MTTAATSVTHLFLDQLGQTAYLAQFVHVGCGGAPRAIPEHRELGCTACQRLWPWEHTLGAAVAEAGFRSLVREDA